MEDKNVSISMRESVARDLLREIEIDLDLAEMSLKHYHSRTPLGLDVVRNQNNRISVLSERVKAIKTAIEDNNKELK